MQYFVSLSDHVTQTGFTDNKQDTAAFRLRLQVDCVVLLYIRMHLYILKPNMKNSTYTQHKVPTRFQPDSNMVLAMFLQCSCDVPAMFQRCSSDVPAMFSQPSYDVSRDITAS